MLSPENFIEMFPFFKEVDVNRISFWISIFEDTYSEDRFAQFWERACYLFVAHNLYLEMKAGAISVSEDGSATIPSTAQELAAGTISSTYKAVGPLIKSTSYNSRGATALSGEGDYGLTIYGKQFWRIVNIIGIGILYAPGSAKDNTKNIRKHF